MAEATGSIAGNTTTNPVTLLEDLVNAVGPHEANPLRTPTPYDVAILGNSSVAHTCYEYTKKLEAGLAAGLPFSEAVEQARQAYRGAMPPMSGAQNIRDFIACVVHAMLIGAIPSAEATRLLYAAQVAGSALGKPTPNRAGRPTY